MKELMFQKKLTLINQTNKKNVCFVITGILKIQVLNFNYMHVMDVIRYDLDDFMILNIKGVDYRCFVCNICKNTAIKLLNSSQQCIIDIDFGANKTLVEVIKEGAF